MKEKIFIRLLASEKIYLQALFDSLNNQCEVNEIAEVRYFTILELVKAMDLEQEYKIFKKGRS